MRIAKNKVIAGITWIAVVALLVMDISVDSLDYQGFDFDLSEMK